MKIGSHVSNSGELMLEGAASEALSLGANCFMVYLGAPQNTYRKNITAMHIKEMWALLEENGISKDDVIIHAPYIVNLAQSDDEKYQYAINFIINEVKMTASVGATYLVIHPGAHLGQGFEYGIKRISEGINQIIEATKDTSVVITIETMAGKGSECGINFTQIKDMIDLVHDKSRIGVCLDTCHIHDAGYDIINKYHAVIDEFDQTIGLAYLKVIHLNDSKNECGSHKDRHENFGFGMIGFDALMQFVNDSRFSSIPKILETPYVAKQYEPYKYEIAMIKSGKFNPHLLNDIIELENK